MRNENDSWMFVVMMVVGMESREDGPRGWPALLTGDKGEVVWSLHGTIETSWAFISRTLPTL